MQKRLAQAASVALLFAALTAPAFAQGNSHGDDHEGRGKNFGLSVKEQHEAAHILQVSANACREDARKAYITTLETANDTRELALETARATQEKGLIDAKLARLTATLSARAAFRASSKDAAAQNAFAIAKTKAMTDWQTAKTAIHTAFEAAKTVAQTKWKTAKDAADAAFSAAKSTCQATVVTDTVAPAAITTLSLSGATSSSIVLTWTASGDDGATGTASSYDIRYSTSPILTVANFTAASQVASEPVPAIAGTNQSMTVTGLAANTTYFFAIESQDEAANVSGLSNVPSLATAL